jgi:hypothetical protein
MHELMVVLAQIQATMPTASGLLSRALRRGECKKHEAAAEGGQN